MKSSAHLPSDSAEQEADFWVARRMDCAGWSEDDEQAWREWLAESPRHREVFRRSETALGLLGSDVFAAEKVARWLGPHRRSARRRRWRWAVPVAALLAVSLAVGLFFTSRGEMATSVGERRAFTLRDGTVANLDAGTSLRVRFFPWRRTVRLESGGAVFKVASGWPPFVVEAADCSIRDTGTTFEVRLRSPLVHASARVEVAVLESSVEISSANGARTLALSAGHLTTWSGREANSAVLPFPARDFAGWQEGRLHYRGAPLGDVLADLQRYSPAPLVLADPAQARLEVSGTLRTDNLADSLEMLRNILPVRIHEEASRIFLERDETRADEAEPPSF